MDSERVTGFRPGLTSWVRLEAIGPPASIVCVMDGSISIKVDIESPKREGLRIPNPHPSVPLYMKDRQLLFLSLIFLEGSSPRVLSPMGLESTVREQKECLGCQLSPPPLSQLSHKPKELTRSYSGGREASLPWVGDEKGSGNSLRKLWTWSLKLNRNVLQPQRLLWFLRLGTSKPLSLEVDGGGGWELRARDFLRNLLSAVRRG